MLVQDCSATLTQPRFGRVAVLLDVGGQGQAEANHPFGKISGGFPLHRQDAEEEGAHAARQQVVLVAKMNVERRATDSGAMEDLGDGNAVVGLLTDE